MLTPGAPTVGAAGIEAPLLQVRDLAVAARRRLGDLEIVHGVDLDVAAGEAVVLDGCDLVYERYALWGRTATAWAQQHHVPSVLEVNAPLVEEQARHRGLVDRAAAEQVALDALASAGTVVCVTDEVRAWARDT